MGMKYAVLGILLFVFLQSCSPKSDQIPSLTSQAEEISEQAKAQARKQEYESAARLFHEAYDLALADGDSGLAARCINNSGVLNYKLGKYKAGLQELKTALGLHTAQQNDSMAASSHLNLGILLSEQALYEEAVAHLLDAMLVFNEHKSEKRMASASNTLANVYGELGQVDLAIKYHRQALVLHQHISYPEGTVTSLNNLGMLFLRSKQHDTAP